MNGHTVDSKGGWTLNTADIWANINNLYASFACTEKTIFLSATNAICINITMRNVETALSAFKVF